VATTAGVEIKFTQVPGYVCQLVILKYYLYFSGHNRRCWDKVHPSTRVRMSACDLKFWKHLQGWELNSGLIN